MTQRERTIGIGVGLAALAIAGFMAVRSLSSSFDTRHDGLVKLEKEFGQKTRTVQAGERAAKQFSDFTKFSLPGDKELADALYSQWLLNRIVGTGISSPDVVVVPARKYGDVCLLHSFHVDFEADLKQVTTFLHGFYQVGYLHRIGRLKLSPLAGKKELNVSMTIEALALKDAPIATELTPPPSARFADAKIEQYFDTVIERNLFSPGNNVPKLASLSTQRGNPKRSLSFSVKGTDADAGDKLSYSLEGSELPGAKLDSKTGEFRWTPDKVGDYEVMVRVADDGLPSRSSVEKVKISIAEAPPEVAQAPTKKKLDFDPAEHAFVTAIVQTNGKWQVWVTVRTEGKILRFEEGDKVSVGQHCRRGEEHSRRRSRIRT